MQVTPVLKLNNFNDERQDRFEQELFAAYTLNPKMQLTAFYSGKFEDKNHTVSAGLSVFFKSNETIVKYKNASQLY